jgi:hypothetical protein
MSNVGGLVWKTGIKMEIAFSVLYLSRFTQKPRQHHLNMATHLVKYIHHTKHFPLVLGGQEQIQIIGYTDAFYATAANGRSISGNFIRLGNRAGAILAKSKKASTSVVLSSYEAELDLTANAVKSIARIDNVLTEMRMKTVSQSVFMGR